MPITHTLFSSVSDNQDQMFLNSKSFNVDAQIVGRVEAFDADIDQEPTKKLTIKSTYGTFTY